MIKMMCNVFSPCLQIRNFVSVILLLSPCYAVGGDMEEVDPKKHIRQVVNDDVLSGWVITADFDVDNDGDMDFLVAHEYESSGSNVSWWIFFKENEKFYLSKELSTLSGNINKFDFRSVDAFGGKKAFVVYSKLNAARGSVWAHRYEKKGSGEIVRHDKKLKSIELSHKEGESEDDWEFLEKNFNDDSIASQVLSNYKRYSKQEAKEKFGGVDSSAVDEGTESSSKSESPGEKSSEKTRTQSGDGSSEKEKIRNDFEKGSDQPQKKLGIEPWVATLGVMTLIALGGWFLYRRHKARSR